MDFKYLARNLLGLVVKNYSHCETRGIKQQRFCVHCLISCCRGAMASHLKRFPGFYDTNFTQNHKVCAAKLK